MNHPRRGTTILEVSIAAALMAALLVGTTQMLVLIAQQRRASQRRLAAVLEATNVMEQVNARNWDALTPEAVGQIALSDVARRALGGGRLTIDVIAGDQSPAAKRIVVEVDWPDRSGQSSASVRLVAWKYRIEGQQP